MRWALLVVSILVWSVGAAHAEEPWEVVRTANGVRYEKRRLAGSKYFVHRATFFVALEPGALQDRLWAMLESLRGPKVASREVLRRTATELVLHDYIKTPIVSDRELTLLFTKITRPPLSIRYDIRNDLGPPPAPNRVLLLVVRGGWRIDAAPGGSEVTYDSYSEPAGAVPAWVVRGPQQDQIVEDVERVKERLR